MKIICVCLSSTLQRTISFSEVKLQAVNRSQKYRMDASGKAVNSARILSQLEEGSVTTICPLGQNNAELFIQKAKEHKLNLEYVTIPGNTRECWTLLDRTAGTTTELVVGEPEITEDCTKAEEELLALIKKNLKTADALLLAGSRPKIWSSNLYQKIAEITLAENKILLADYWAEDLLQTLKTAVPSIIKINDEEYCRTFKLNYPVQKKELKEEITRKSKELDNIIIVTRGTFPTYAAQKGRFMEVPTEKVKAVNTTACGDSFNAGFLYEYVKSADFEKALQKATWAAARNAENEAPGTVCAL